MSLFIPDFFYDKIWDIPLSFLKENDIKCLLLDVDNTLTTHDNPTAHEKAVKWLDLVSEAGIKSVIISNNIESRVAPFADNLGVQFVFNAQKPLSKGAKQAIKISGVNKENMLVIGDQIFTDVLFGKLSGIKTILVKPMELEKTNFFKFKRWLEKLILRGKRK